MLKKILIVDDEIKEYRKCKSILAPYSHDIKLSYAPHGPAALDRINVLEPDIIFLDQQFKKENVLRGNLFYKDKGAIVQHRSDDMVAEEHETKQGLYIIQKIREQGFQGWIVFLTAYAADLTIANEALRLGEKNTDYTSKDRLKPGNEDAFITIIEDALSLKLISMPQKIRNILIQYCGNIPNQEECLIVNALVNSATVKRRRGFAFVETVLKRLKAEHKHITFSAFSRTMDLANKEWKSEPVEPCEILHWVLSHLDCNELPKNSKEWNYVDRNTLRYIFQTTINGKHIFLKIIHPKYSKEIIPLESGDKYTCFPLDESDPDWEGTHVGSYLEEGIVAKTLREYADNLNAEGLMDANNIHSILTNIVSILKKLTNGHGMIDVDSIHYVSNSVWLADLMLWNYVNEEGKKMIEGIILDDRKQRDIQSLGIIGKYLIFGNSKEIELKESRNSFFCFLKQCLDGTWNLQATIPVPISDVSHSNNGPYASILEREFSNYLIKILMEENLNTLIYFNTHIKLKPPITNEVDAFVIRPGKVFWLDIKGKMLNEETERMEKTQKLNERIGLLKDLLGKMGLNTDRVSGYYVVRDEIYSEIDNNSSDAEKLVIRSYSKVIEEIKKANQVYYNLDKFKTNFKGHFYKREESPYEDSHAFKQDYGNVKKYTKGLISELDCESPYYIRRYSLDHSCDSILEFDELKKLISEADREIGLISKFSSEYILAPEKILFINSQNERTVPLIEFKEGSRGINPDIRWIYKVYKKPGKNFGCLLQLKDYLNEITEDEKVKLLCHYLTACNDLLNSKCNMHFDKDSLKIYKNTEDNKYVGVIEPVLTGNIQIKDILIIFDVLDDGKGTLTSLRKKVSEAKDANSVLGELIKTLTELIHHKEKYEDKRKELIIDFPDKNTQFNSIQKPMSSVQEITPDDRLKGHQKKNAEAESVSTKQPEKKTQGILAGTVKWFNDKKGFGFIAQDNGDDVFVHQTSIQGAGFRTLAEGDKVAFEIIKDEKGNRATNVVKL